MLGGQHWGGNLQDGPKDFIGLLMRRHTSLSFPKI